MAKITDKQLNKSTKDAEVYLTKFGLDLTDLSEVNVQRCNQFLKSVYSDWRSGKIPDLVACSIGEMLEYEPIHHLMSVSVYPLCDIYFHIGNGDLKSIKNSN